MRIAFLVPDPEYPEPWRWAFEGCHTDRHTAATIRAAGFPLVEVEEFQIRTAFVPVRTQITGVATV